EGQTLNLFGDEGRSPGLQAPAWWNMAVLSSYRHKQTETQGRGLPLRIWTAAAVGGVILGLIWLVAAPTIWGALFVAGGVAALLALGAAVVRAKESERAALAQAHAALDSEYTSLQA